MKNIIRIVVALFAIFATTACMDEKAGNDATWTKAYEGVMTTTNQETQVSSTDNATVTIYQGSMFKNFVDITISDVRFVPMMPDVEFIIKDINFELAKVDDQNDPLYGIQQGRGRTYFGWYPTRGVYDVQLPRQHRRRVDSSRV